MAESFSLWVPLLLDAIAYALCNIAAGVTAGRGNAAAAERLRNIGFLLVLLGGAWVVVLLLIALIDTASAIGDMLVIMLVIVAFFAILLLAFFGISQLIGLIRRGLSRRERVTTQDL